MGLFDWLLGNKRAKRNADAPMPKSASRVELQTDEQRDASRSKMEAEMDASRTSREAASAADEEGEDKE